MNSDIKMDILFAGLLLIPIVVSAVPYIQNKLVSYVRKKTIFVYPLPISVYLIYAMSVEGNIFGMIGLFVGFFLFFFTYAVSISLLASAIKTRNRAN